MAEASDLGSDVVQHKEEQAEQHEHEHEHHAGHCEHHHHGAPFDLTILVPKARFTASLSGGNAGKAASSGSSSSDNLDDYVPLFLPATDVDVLRDIKQSVADSAEGFWIGSHSYQRVTLREEAPAQEGDEPKLFLEGQASDTFLDSTDLATVFAGEEYKSGELRRALKAVDTPYTDSEARAHVLRVRDASLSYTAALHAKRVYQPPPYDPSQMLIDGGLSLFTAIRGPEEIEGNPVAEQSEDAQVNGAPSSKSSKKAKGKAAKPAKVSKPAAPTPAAKKESTPFVPSASFLDADQDAQAIYLARKDLLPKSSLPPPSFRNLQLSVWNPPPQHLRLRGHYLYLNVATLEGENYHISATRDGFYVNKSDNHHFDPSPKSQPSKAHPQGHITHHTLFGLLAALSSQFAERTQALISEVIPMSPDFFASIAITNCLPAAPWLVPSPDPVADGARSQTAYLLTGATNAEFLPNTKDWNEELTSMRELPRESNDERLMRDRYACRLHADFQLAAARGVMSIARGDVPPLNAIDASEANSYLAYNILFTPAQDSVDTYKHLGGDEAARVTASKDIWATKLLSDADIPGLHTIATAIIDYCGERWIAQAIPPGIFNKTSDENKETAKKEEQADGEATEKDEGKKEKTTDEEAAEPEESAKKVPQSVGLRAVYGPANTDKPYEQYVAEASFEPLAQKIAEHFHLAKHTVTDSKGRELEMWTPADVHGLIGSDGRSYAIDLFRLTPVDVKFLEEDSTKIFGQDGKSEKEEDAYPHRVTLLRPELVEVYHSIKTREWIEAQVQAQTEKDKAAETPAVPAIEDGDNSVEKPESATSEDFVKVDKEGDTSTQKKGEDADKPKEKKQTVINVADFKLAFNPDAFVDRPDLPAGHWISKTDEEDENTKAVRQASEYLRSTVIPSLMWEIISEETLPLDSSELSQMLHKRGINIRYLGHIAELCKTAPPTKSSVTRTPEAEQEVVNFLAKFRSFLIGDMIMRGAKHVLRKLIKDITAVELTEVVAHFLNCFLGAALSAEPKPVNTTNSSNTWTTLTPAALREQVSREVLRRYRFVLPESAFEEDLSKLRTLRELCLATGIQLELRNYTFKKAQANGHAEEASTQEQKKQGGAKKARSASPTPAERETTFVPEDILNVHPVVKNAPFKSSLADDILERGQMYFIRGNVEMGEAFVSDGLNMYDQIYGAVHPEMAEAYRQIGGLYHRMAAPLLRRIQLYEQTRSLARDEDRERIKKETGISTDEELEGAKYQHEIYLQQAVKLMRQAVVISERVHGIDSSETLHCYSELAIFEHSIGNAELALKLLQHTVALSNAMYGQNHPEKARAAFFAASMMKGFDPQNQLAAVPFFRSAQALAQKAYGSNSIMSANASYQLGQCYIVDGQLAESVPYIEEALRIFELRHGKEGEHTRDASQLLSVVKTAIEQEAKGELEKVEKLAKRIGADPARAKELISRMQSTSAGSSLRRGGRSTAQKAADEAVEASSNTVKAAKDTTGSRGHLDVDDLVLYIEGEQKKASTSSKGGKSKKGGSKK